MALPDVVQPFDVTRGLGQVTFTEAVHCFEVIFRGLTSTGQNPKGLIPHAVIGLTGEPMVLRVHFLLDRRAHPWIDMADRWISEFADMMPMGLKLEITIGGRRHWADVLQELAAAGA